jgi:hypothetical protein
MVAEARGGVKPANPVAERKTGQKYDFQSVASPPKALYGAKQRADRPDLSHAAVT